LVEPTVQNCFTMLHILARKAARKNTISFAEARRMTRRSSESVHRIGFGAKAKTYTKKPKHVTSHVYAKTTHVVAAPPWICMCDHTHDVHVSSKPVQGFWCHKRSKFGHSQAVMLGYDIAEISTISVSTNVISDIQYEITRCARRNILLFASSSADKLYCSPGDKRVPVALTSAKRHRGWEMAHLLSLEKTMRSRK